MRRLDRVAPILLLLCVSCQGPGEEPPTDPEPTPCSPPDDPVGILDVDDGQWIFRDVGHLHGFQSRVDTTQGLAVADIDGDGDLDVLVSSDNAPVQLLVNQVVESGSLAFEDHPSPPSVDFPWSASFGDYDNDGDPDVYLACGGFYAACKSALFRNDGPDPDTGHVVFTDVSVQSTVADIDYRSLQGHWIDFDRDGLLDLFVSVRIPRAMWGSGPDLEIPRENRLFRNLGNDAFEDVAPALGLDNRTDSGAAAWADFNGDGWLDVFVPTLMGANTLYLSVAGESFTAITEGFAKPILSLGASAGDFDGDGDIDILVSEYNQDWVADGGFFTQGHGLYLNDGTGQFTESGDSSGLTEAAGGGMGTLGYQRADLDFDGKVEHFFGNGGPYAGGGESNRIFTYDIQIGGEGAWVERSAPFHNAAVHKCDEAPPESEAPYRTHAVVIADLDLDSRPDVLVGNAGREWDQYETYPYEPNRLFLNESEHSNSALWVNLEGGLSNRDGIGAVLTLTASPSSPDSPWAHTALLGTSQGLNTSTPPVVTFGLGTRTGPFDLHILWPSGIEQTVNGITAGEQLNVIEPSS